MQTTFDSGGEWVAAMQGARAARRRWRRRQRIASEWRALKDIGRALRRRIVAFVQDLRQPGHEERDPFPRFTPADRGAAVSEWLLTAVGVAFALVVLVALSMALGYEW